ncbi:hypothetical protein OCU04_009918 [Sclerotinia nivalis]|uniref:Uncharacterized protein n=1 Tax=Sclerotinia nivalis TaxID=352851 RepID=A0A9X0AEE6_9HELO|nr:hypothetical protein OCU04_009918 [Sclerotinia nivalis]
MTWLVMSSMYSKVSERSYALEMFTNMFAPKVKHTIRSREPFFLLVTCEWFSFTIKKTRRVVSIKQRKFRAPSVTSSECIGNRLFVHCQTNAPLIFGTSFAHRSGPNNSTDDRRVLYATYNRAADGDNPDAYFLERAKRYPLTQAGIG